MSENDEQKTDETPAPPAEEPKPADQGDGGGNDDDKPADETTNLGE